MLVFWHVGGVEVIEAAILSDDDDDVLDRARGFDRVAIFVSIVIVICSDWGAEPERRYCEHE
jgi:hypothetical protein